MNSGSRWSAPSTRGCALFTAFGILPTTPNACCALARCRPRCRSHCRMGPRSARASWSAPCICGTSMCRAIRETARPSPGPRRCGDACCARSVCWRILSSVIRAGRQSGRFAAARPCPAASAGCRCKRLARRHGFEPAQPPATLSRQLQTVADSLIVWGLTRAFNPAALPRQRFLRDHNELWISRSVLLKFYGRDDRSLGTMPPFRTI